MPLLHVLIGSADPDRCAILKDALQWEAPGAFRLQTTDWLAAAAAVHQECPDVLVLAHAGPTSDVCRQLGAVRGAGAGTRTLVLREALDDEDHMELLRAGAAGAMLQSDAGAFIVKAIRAVHAGQPWFPRITMYRAIHRLAVRFTYNPSQGDEVLTRRENQILELIGSGLTNKEIARRLEISDGTVKTHLHRIYVKLRQSGRYKAFLAQALPGPEPHWPT